MADEVTKEEIKETIKDATQDAIKEAADNVPQSKITTKTETSEEIIDTDRDGKYSPVEILRFAMRPFLIVWFSMTLTIIAVYGLHSRLLDAKETLYVISGIMSTIIGYVCGKSSKVDKE